MDYDPIKDRFGAVVKGRPFFRKIFYFIIQTLFLRNWYVRRSIKEIASKRDSGPFKVLDAGTGFAQHSYFILKHIPEADILAVDVKEDYLEDAKQFTNQLGLSDRIRYQEADLTKFQTKEKVDLIVCIDVMEHILEDVDVFKNFAASLKDGGKVIINTPSDQGGSDVSHDSDESFIGEHVRDGYGVEEITEKLASAGLTVEKAMYSYGGPGSFAWKFLVQIPMIMLNTTMFFVLLLPLYYPVVYPVGMLLNWMDLKKENVSGTGLQVIASR